MSDYEAAYRDVRVRVSELLLDHPDAEIERLAPATPEWRVRDVVAHLGGVCDDIANGNMAGVGTNDWTKAQVDKRLDWELPRVLDDWTQHARTVEPMLNEIGQPMGQLVFDAWSHEQDIRGSLGEPGGVTLELVTDDGTYVIGAGEPDRTLRTSRYEFLRTVTGRRSRAQVRALDCDGPPLDEILFESDVFTPAAHDVVE